MFSTQCNRKKGNFCTGGQVRLCSRSQGGLEGPFAFVKRVVDLGKDS